jgi:hypothetical protein
VPGIDELNGRSWTTYNIDLGYMCDCIINKLSEANEDFPSYEILKSMPPDGWQNHNYLVLLYYLDKFPGRTLMSIIEESDARKASSPSRRWPEKYSSVLERIAAPGAKI